MFEQAMADAAALDEYMRIHKKPKGPLHGLPISVKEHVKFVGTPATSGFIAWADEYATEDAMIIKVLRAAGAIFHVKTTNPQALMALETTSSLYGTTTNPHNTSLTPGGSSGGESALIAMRGSLLGIGTDIGGSIRAPCAFSGIYGIKPSIGRLPHGGLAGVHGGMENIVGCVGPMATCLEDLSLFCSVVLAASPWTSEVSLIPMPWDTRSVMPETRRLRIGIMLDDGVVHPHPPITRTFTSLAEGLRASGHHLIPFSAVLHREVLDCIHTAYYLDSGEEYHEVLQAGQEPPIPLLDSQLSQAGRQTFSVQDTWAINRRRSRLQEAYAKQWNEAGLDCLICPIAPSVAPKHGEATYWGYTSVFNSLDLSSAVLPVGFVSESDTWEAYPRTRVDFSGVEDQRYDGYYKPGVEGPKSYEGAPIAVQIVGRRLSEEAVLEIAAEIERSWNEYRMAEEMGCGPKL